MMTPRERLLSALSLEQPDRVPYFEYAIDERLIESLNGRRLTRHEVCHLYDVCDVEFWKKPPVFAEGRKSDIGREYLGAGLISCLDDWHRVSLPEPVTPQEVRAARQFIYEKQELAAGLVINLSADPVLMSLGYERFALTLYDDPGLIEEMSEGYTNWTLKVLEAFQELPFDFVLSGDDLAFKTAPFFSPEVFQRVFLPHMRRVAQSIERPWIHHSDGNLLPILDDLLSLGMNGLHPVEPAAMDIFWLKEHYGRRVCLCGNFDVNILALGTPDEVRAEVKRKVCALKRGGGHVAASSTSIPEYVRPENFAAMVDELRRCGVY